MKKATCRYCGEEFVIKWERNPNLLCSLKCKYRETGERQKIIALTNNPMYKEGIKEKAVATRMKNGTYYTGDKHPNWKYGYWLNRDGYKMIQNKKDTNGVAIAEHRKIMEEELGRKLDSSEIIHHKNGDRLDNKIDNLKIVNRSTHFYLHMDKITK